MAFDAHLNFAYSTVAVAPVPATSGTALTVQTGDGAKFPTVSFNATVWPTGAQPTTANAEIVRVTTIATDVFTITRTQESTSARTIVTGDQIAATITAKTLTDVEGGIPVKASAAELNTGTDDAKFATAAAILASTLLTVNGAKTYAADGGATDAYAITLSPVPAAYVTGMVVNFKANTANTGACTLNVNSLGAKTIKKSLNVDLDTNDIKAGQFVSVVYDGTNFQMFSVGGFRIEAARVQSAGGGDGTWTFNQAFTVKPFVFFSGDDGINVITAIQSSAGGTTYVNFRTYIGATLTGSLYVNCLAFGY